jgi:hypothetical protein
MPPTENYIDTLVLGSAHSLVLPHKFEKVPTSDLAIMGHSPIDHGKYGLFNISSPNLNTYYPDVKPADLKPEAEDFIMPVFRLLSEVVVHKHYNPVDFRTEGVLKASAPLLVGQTIYADHEQITGNHIGVVFETYWQDEYTTNGVKVPGGINGVLKIDGKSNPKIARGILMDPPAIHSTSVAVMYRWAKSHDLNNDDFYNKLGTFNSKGELIRKIATEILLYQELSLVPHGADPFAQLIKGDKITNPAFAKKVYHLGGDKFAYTDYKNIPTGDIEIEISKNNQNSFTSKKRIQMDKFLKLASKVGFEVKEEMDEDQLIEFITDKFSENLKNESDYAKEIQTLKSEKIGLEEKLQTATDNLASLEEKKTLIGIGETHLADVKAEAEKFYRLNKGDSVDTAIIELIGKSELSVISSLLKEYKSEFESKNPLTCKACKSDDVSRASASLEGEEGGKNTPRVLSNHEVIENRKRKSFSVSRIHGS